MRSASTSPQASRLIGSKSYWFAWRERARARIDALSPRQRQYGILTVLLGSGIALLWIVLSLSNPAPDRQHVDPTVQGNTSVTNVGVLPPGAQLNPVDQWVGTAGRKLAQYETEREEQSRLNKDRQSFETRTMQRFAELEQRLTSAQQGGARRESVDGCERIPGVRATRTTRAPGAGGAACTFRAARAVRAVPAIPYFRALPCGFDRIRCPASPSLRLGDSGLELGPGHAAGHTLGPVTRFAIDPAALCDPLGRPGHLACEFGCRKSAKSRARR